jgi:hypothetical protein
MQPFTRPLTYSTALAVLWMTLASLNPDLTYHLAPLLIAGTAPVAMTTTGDPSTTTLSIASLMSASVGLVATAALAIADRLRGPSLLPWGGAVLEAIAFVAVGASIGLVVSLIIRK